MPRLKVRGNCPKCGTSREELADTGRVTWRGPCNKKDCDGTLILRKFHTTENGGETSNGNENPNPTPSVTRRGTPRKVPKVGYNQPPESNSESGSSGKPAEVPDAGDGSGSGEASTASDAAVPVEPVKSGRKRKREYPYGGLFNW